MQTLVLVFALVAGIVGTGVGGVLGVVFKNKNEYACDALVFAAGIMLGVAAFEMFPEAVNECVLAGKKFFGALIAVCCVLVAVLAVKAVDFAVDKIKHKKENMGLEHRKTEILSANCNSVEILKKRAEQGLKKAGIITFFAIAFHNIPEGMAIGASGIASVKTGLVVALVIALHNIPEGMAVSAPLVNGGTGVFQSVVFAILAGATTVVGAVLGILLGGTQRIADGICIAVAAGAMMYVSCFELLPTALKLKGEFQATPFFLGICLAMIFSLFV